MNLNHLPPHWTPSRRQKLRPITINDALCVLVWIAFCLLIAGIAWGCLQ